MNEINTPLKHCYPDMKNVESSIDSDNSNEVYNINNNNNRNNIVNNSSISYSENWNININDSENNSILLINCKLRRSQSSLHTARRCIPNVPTYISNDHEHQNGTINSSLVGVIIGDWKFYNHQGLCFNSKRSIRDGLMDITCGLMISQDRNLIRLFVTCIVLTDWTNMACNYIICVIFHQIYLMKLNQKYNCSITYPCPNYLSNIIIHVKILINSLFL
ncbi:hypothetical protein H8356DRAFT_1331841 [Neocallimastix lanati (nom. inval.)]|nr:hypothetical protein H8356DRAFT_1331841 [Neocallimastix sp. JGI-2020a]